LLLLFVFLFTSCSPATTPAKKLSTATAATTATPTLIPSPTPSPTPEFPVRDGGTLSPGATIISKDNLSQLTELAIWGKGVAKNIVWADDGKSIMVETTIGSYSYDLNSFQLISKKSGGFIEAGQKISLSVDGYNFNDPYGGFDVKVYDNKKSQSVGSFRVDDGVGWPNLTYLPDSDLIVVERDSLGVQLRDAATYEIFDTIGRNPYDKYSSAIVVSKNRRAEAIGEMNGKILLRTGERFSNSFNLETEGPVRILSFSSDGTKLASESGGDVFIWDVITGQKIGTISETFMSGDFFNNEQTWRDTGYVSISDNILAIADHNTVNIFNVHNGKKENRYAYPTIYEGAYINPDGTKKPETFYLPVNNVFFSTDEKYLISTLRTNTTPTDGYHFDRIYTRDLSSGQIVQSMDQDTFLLTASTYSAANHLLMTGDAYRSSIRLWNVDDASNPFNIIAWKSRQIFSSQMDVTRSLAISPNGELVLSWSVLEGVANLWEIKSQRKVMAIKIPACDYSKCSPNIAFAAISPDNTKLIISLSPYDSHIAAVYSIPDGKELYRLSSHYSVFSPDSSMIITSEGTKKILFYDAETGTLLGNVDSHSRIQLPYVSKDGKNLITISTNGTIGIWGIP
jgi:hypothetical protein